MARDAPLHEVIKDLEVTDVTVGKLARDRGDKHPDLYAKLLMACEGDQVTFLINLYDMVAPDTDTKVGWLALVKNGFFLDLLDPDSPKAQDLIRAVQFGIMTTRDLIGVSAHVCSRCKRTRR